MHDFLTLLRDKAATISADMESDRFLLRSLVKVHAQFLPQSIDLPYTDTIVVAQTFGSGSCYCHCEDPELPTKVLGLDARYIKHNSRCVEIAILDAVYSNLLITPDICCRLEGSPAQKAEARASLIVFEVLRQVQEAHLIHPRIVMVGAVGNILLGMMRFGWEIYATDLDTTLIGKNLGGVTVEDGNSVTIERISQANIVLITGMTLATNTMEDIFSTAITHGVRIIVFAQTGGNFAGEFLNLGVKCVISEEYPFYMFPGITTLRIFRSKS